jgi:L-alanine-DL-glutamate epimerase-like enolase superfamily enzyme
MKLSKDISGLELKISKIEGFALSSKYGDNKVFGQPKGFKSIGFVSVIVDNGKQGLGETYSGIYVPELIGPVISFFSNKLVGMKLIDVISNLGDFIDIPFVGFSGLIQSVKSAISIACLDVLSKSVETPIYKLFGSKLQPIKVYISGGSVVYSPQQVYEDANKLKDLGFNNYKMRIGHQDLNTDILRIKEAISVFGNDNSVIVDLIEGTLKSSYDEKTLKKIFNELNKFNFNWVEEPIEPSEMNKLLFIKSISKNSIATGEAYSGLTHFKNLLNPNYIDIIQYDYTHSGDFNTCFEISKIAKRNNIDQVLHVWGSSLALHSNAIFSLINKKIKFLEVPSVSFELSKDISSANYSIENGYLNFDHDFLGTGVEINNKIKNQYKFIKNTGYSI